MAGFLKRRCPEEDAFVRLFLNNASGGEREKILSHLRTCPRCRIRFDFLRQVRGLVRKKEETLQALALQSWAEVETRTRRRARLTVWPRSWAARAGAAAGILLVLAAAVVFSLLTTGRSDVLRGGGRTEVRLLDPAGPVSQSPLYFRWTSVDGADFYAFDLVDDDLRTIIETSTSAPYLLLSAEDRSLLRPDKIYIWSVIAFDDADVKLAEGHRSFAIE